MAAKMTPKDVKAYYRQRGVVDHYVRATSGIGLWRSEEKVFTRLFNKDDALIELGCGAGRIALGLYELGYRNVLGVDFAREMIEQARVVAQTLDARVFFNTGDVLALKYDREVFDGAIFGFNGLMQIPGRDNRRRAIREINRVLVPGAWFVFTAHDRESHGPRAFWKEQQRRWDEGEAPEEWNEFGDVVYETDEAGGEEGLLCFIHSATREEIIADITDAGFRHEADALRSELANEPREVREFADDTRFWVVQKEPR